MKLLLVIANALLASATPFTSNDDSVSLEARGKSKCQWKEKRCCDVWSKPANKYDEPDYGYRYGGGYKKTRTIYVKEGQSINHAIKKANYGDRIIVKAGKYPEQVTVNKDGIQLIGQKGATIVKPKNAVKNICTGLAGDEDQKPGVRTQTGICVTGSEVKLEKFINEHRRVLSVKRPVKDVAVTGFTVEGFTGVGIAVIGGHNTKVAKNNLIDSAKYGGLTVGSTNTVFSENVVKATVLGFIGICMDNKSKTLITKNKLSNQIIGLCVQTNQAQLQHNTVTSSCYGIIVDPGVRGAKVSHNYIGPSNPLCIEYKVGVTGIVVDGATNTEIRDNTIEGQKGGAGLSIVDDECKGTKEMPQSITCYARGGRKAISSGTVVIRNTFIKNDFDIFVNTTGTGNVVSCNKCATPADLCSM